VRVERRLAEVAARLDSESPAQLNAEKRARLLAEEAQLRKEKEQLRTKEELLRKEKEQLRALQLLQAQRGASVTCAEAAVSSLTAFSLRAPSCVGLTSPSPVVVAARPTQSSQRSRCDPRFGSCWRRRAYNARWIACSALRR
jgi:hypothetical protein